MGRSARITCPELVYHVINRGNNRQAVFQSEEDYIYYLNAVRRYKKEYCFKLFAFCLMTNHIHLAVKVSDKGSISQIMHSITVAYIRYFNHKYERSGHVWQGRFLSPIVSEDGHLLNVMRYIEQNPLRAGMVSRIDQYPWSSYRLNIKEKESVLIDRSDNEVFQALADNHSARIIAYKELMKENLEEQKIKEIRDSTAKGHDYLSSAFKEKLAFLMPKTGKRGRPRRNAKKEK